LAIRISLGAAIAGLLAQRLLPVSQDLINLNSDSGEQLLMESKARKDYLPLSIHFVTQSNRSRSVAPAMLTAGWRV